MEVGHALRAVFSPTTTKGIGTQSVPYDMPIYEIPADATRFEIARGNDGTYLVLSETTGLNGVAISCRTEEQAIDVCERLNRGDHNSTIDVPFFTLPTK